MVVSLKQLIFLFLFSLLLLLQIILGESYLKLLILGIWSTFFFLYSKELNWQSLGKYTLLIYLWLAWIILLITSSFFTHSVPLTITSIAEQFFTFCIFIFFLSIQEKFMPTKYLLFVVGITILISLLLSGFVLITPGWGSLLPGMNLLYPSYGHTHLGALLLLVIPLSWWWALQKKKIFWVIIPTLLFAGLVLCFGRVASLIGLCELAILVIYFWKKNKIITKPIVFASILSVIFLLPGIVTQAYFTLSSKHSTQECPFPRFERQLCKSGNDEPRFYYWQQAVKGIRENPFLGYGPGTFPLLNTKYRQIPGLSTLYAHNEYLQTMAETGILAGGIWITLWFWLLVMLYKRAQKNNGMERQYIPFLFLGIAAVYLNNFFDFDWHFSATLGLTVMLLALGLKTSERTTKTQDSLFLQTISKFYYVFLIGIFCFASLYFWVNSLIQKNNQVKAFSIFPYFFAHYGSFATSKQLTASQQAELHTIYTYYSDNYPIQTFTVKDSRIVATIDPWKFIDIFDPQSLSVPEILSYAHQFEQQLKQAKNIFNYDDYLLADRVSEKLHQASYRALTSEEKQMGYELYLVAARINPWSIHSHKPAVDWYMPDTFDCQFLQEISILPTEPFGDQREVFSWGYIRCLAIHFSEMDTAQITTFAQRAVKLSPWLQPEIFSEIQRENKGIEENPELQKKLDSLVTLFK